MLAVKGVYDNGKVILEDAPLVEMSEVIVVFPDNESAEATGGSTLERKRFLKSFQGA